MLNDCVEELRNQQANLVSQLGDHIEDEKQFNESMSKIERLEKSISAMDEAERRDIVFKTNELNRKADRKARLAGELGSAGIKAGIGALAVTGLGLMVAKIDSSPNGLVSRTLNTVFNKALHLM